MGVDLAYEVSEGLRLALAGSLLRPERSRWLADALPSTFFCVAQARAGATSQETCPGGDQRLGGTASAAWHRAGLGVNASLTGATTLGTNAEQWSALLGLRLSEIALHTDVSSAVSASTGTLGQRAAVDVQLHRRLLHGDVEFSGYYRPATGRYRASSTAYMEHGFGSQLYWFASDTVDASLSADAVAGSNASVLSLFLSLSFRPRF